MLSIQITLGSFLGPQGSLHRGSQLSLNDHNNDNNKKAAPVTFSTSFSVQFKQISDITKKKTHIHSSLLHRSQFLNTAKRRMRTILHSSRFKVLNELLGLSEAGTTSVSFTDANLTGCLFYRPVGWRT